METRTLSGRITAPLAYQTGDGLTQNIPIGPCLIEGFGGRSIDIIWGEQGQRCAALPLAHAKAAHENGHLVLVGATGPLPESQDC